MTARDEELELYFATLWPDDLEAGGSSEEIWLRGPREGEDATVLVLGFDTGAGARGEVHLNRYHAQHLSDCIQRHLDLRDDSRCDVTHGVADGADVEVRPRARARRTVQPEATMTPPNDIRAAAERVLELDRAATPGPWPMTCGFVPRTAPSMSPGYWRADTPAHEFPGPSDEHTPSMKSQVDANWSGMVRTLAPLLAAYALAVEEALDQEYARLSAMHREADTPRGREAVEEAEHTMSTLRAAIARKLEEARR